MPWTRPGARFATTCPLCAARTAFPPWPKPSSELRHPHPPLRNARRSGQLKPAALRRDLLFLRRQASSILAAVRRAADPFALVRDELRARPVAVPRGGRLVVVAVGKAAALMAAAAESVLRARIDAGIVVAQAPGTVPLRRLPLLITSHPLPDARGMRAARHVEMLARGLEAKDVVLALLSGGSSALLPAPVPGVTLDDKRALTRQPAARRRHHQRDERRAASTCRDSRAAGSRALHEGGARARPAALRCPRRRPVHDRVGHALARPHHLRRRRAGAAAPPDRSAAERRAPPDEGTGAAKRPKRRSRAIAAFRRVRTAPHRQQPHRGERGPARSAAARPPGARRRAAAGRRSRRGGRAAREPPAPRKRGPAPRRAGSLPASPAAR